MLALVGPVGCTFNFDVTTQRTALENQVMGSYKELDDDLILASSVRGPSGKARPIAKPALDARLNQQFNQDDLDEYLHKQVLGESADGLVVALPRSLVGHQPAAQDLALALQIASEENRDRATIWQRIIASNEHLSAKDLPNVRLTYAKLRRESVTPGSWMQNEERRWVQKAASKESGL